MGTLEILVRLATGVALVAVNAFFVVTEFSMTRLRQLDESEFRESSRLRLAWEMTERLEVYLTACQLGITSSSILMGVVAEPGVTALIEPGLAFLGVGGESVEVISIVLAVVAINLIHKIWGEQAPTYLGVERPKQVAYWCAPLLYWWTKILYPVIIAGDGLAKWTLALIGVKIERSWAHEEAEEPVATHSRYTEIRRAMGEALRGGPLSKERKREVIRALDIDYIPVRDIQVPREEIVSVRKGATLEENFEVLADERRFSRFPLVGDSPDEFEGVLYIADVFRHLDKLRAGEVRLADLATEPMVVRADLPVSKVIDEFQANNQELALVREEGSIVGLVTITQALETIAGEIDDPFDVAESSARPEED